MERDAEQEYQDELESILASIFERMEEGESLSDLIALYPQHEVDLRRRLSHLEEIGLDKIGDRAAVTVPGFVLQRRLGHGGMGDVWLAREVATKELVALKVLRSTFFDEGQRERFAREAEALQSLDHPGIVKIRSNGGGEDLLWIAMEYIEGRDLAELIKGGDLAVIDILQIFETLADALALAHASEILHRDIKPQNIRVRPNGQPVLIDFGLTRGLEPTSLSTTGGFVGTPQYASPEQVRGDRTSVGPHTDVYGLGVTLYEALAKRRAFSSVSVEALFVEILTADPTPIQELQPNVSRDLATVVHKAIEKEPRYRYANVLEFAKDLDAVLHLKPISARPPSFVRRTKASIRRRPAAFASAAALALAMLVLLTFLVVDHFDRKQEAEEYLRGASAALDEWDRQSEGINERLREFEDWQRRFERQYTAPSDRMAFDEEHRNVATALRNRDLFVSRALELIRKAEDAFPKIEGAKLLRARAYVEKWRAARDAHDTVALEYFAAQVRENDEQGDLSAKVTPRLTIHLTTEPPGARVDFFTYRPQANGEFRLTAWPRRPDQKPSDSDFSYKVMQSKGDLLAGDILFDSTGVEKRPDGHFGMPSAGEMAKIWRHGKVNTFEVPAGVVLRPTMSPLYDSDETFVGETPIRGETISADRAVLLVRLPGYVPVRLMCPWEEVKKPLHVKLVPEGHHPAGILSLYSFQGTVMHLMDGEVSCEHYLEFVNDKRIQRRIQRGELRLPKGWSQRSDGVVELPEGVTTAFPVHGVSWLEAKAYVQWRNQRAESRGAKYRFRLPNWADVQARSRIDGFQRVFPWGAEFRPTFAKSCFSKPTPRLEARFAYPVDETVLGLHDIAGGVSELCEGWFWEEKGERTAAGGSWVYAHPIQFRLEFIKGTKEDTQTDYFGFRVEIVDPDYP